MDIPWTSLSKSYLFGLSNTEHLCRNAQSCIRTSSPALRGCCSESSPCLFGDPASMVWPPHTCCVWPFLGAPKIPLYCTEYNRPTKPGGDCMTITHAIDLLLRKLPPDSCLAHQFPGLVNNLLSIAVLCNAGCKVFFHKTGCNVTLDGKTILQGWHNPKNCLWKVILLTTAGQLSILSMTSPDSSSPVLPFPLGSSQTGYLLRGLPNLTQRCWPTDSMNVPTQANWQITTTCVSTTLSSPHSSRLLPEDTSRDGGD